MLLGKAMVNGLLIANDAGVSELLLVATMFVVLIVIEPSPLPDSVITLLTNFRNLADNGALLSLRMSAIGWATWLKIMLSRRPTVVEKSLLGPPVVVAVVVALVSCPIGVGVGAALVVVVSPMVVVARVLVRLHVDVAG